MNSGQIKIQIMKSPSSVDSELGVQDETQGFNGKKDVEKNSVQSQAITSALIQAGKQAMMQGINNYSQISGDYQTTRKINTAIDIGADILTIAMGGPVGAIVVGTKYALQGVNSAIQTYNANQQINYDNQMLGNISRSGSRYY